MNSKRLTISRNRLLALAIAVLLLAVVAVLPAMAADPGTVSTPTSDNGVVPYIIPGENEGGNRTCEEVGQAFYGDPDYYEFSSDRYNVPVPATIGPFDIQVTDGKYVSWQDGFVEVAFIVKGSDDANVYVYDGSLDEDSGLASPVTGSGLPAALSNLTVCWNEPAAGNLEVTKVVDWSGADPDPNQTFEICIQGPSYPIGNESGACQVADYDGEVLSWLDLQPGDYTVTETDPGASWIVNISGSPATVADGQTAQATVTNTFIPPQPELVKLRVFKYHDLNQDGSHLNFGPDKEPGLEDWVFNVYDANNQLVDSQKTGPNGYYTWDVTAGLEYTVCEELQPYWVNTEPGTPPQGGEVCYPAQVLEPREEPYLFNFGNFELAPLRVFKYHDLNKDGSHLNFGDDKEPGLEDWVFNVYDDEDLLVDSKMTGPNGYYTWWVPPGEYTVCEVLQDGWVNTQAGILKPGTSPGPGGPNEVCAPLQAFLPVEEIEAVKFGNYFEEPPPGFCPPDELVYEVTDVLGIGQGSPTKAYRSRTLYIPDYEEVVWLYGQLAAVDVGQMRFVRFRYPDKSYVQIKDPTSPAYHTYMINWWGDYLEPAKYIKGQFFWKKSARFSPRAFVLWPTYMTDEPYANTFRFFDVSKENHVFWNTEPDAAYEWFPEQTQKLLLPATQLPGADIVVKIALVDVNMDQRPVILTVSAGGVSESRVIYVSNKNKLLNLETFLLEGVGEGTSEVEIHLLSPAPSADYPEGGDSVAMIGAAAHYACIDNGNNIDVNSASRGR